MSTEVPSLAGWGASPDADLVYRRLAGFGSAPPAVLARELGVSRRRVGQALDELAALGAARRAVRSNVLVWEPVAAADVVARLRAARRRQPAGAGAGLGKASSTMAEALAHGERLDDGMRYLTRPLTRVRLGELAAVARHEHLAMNPEPVFEVESARPAVAMDRTLLQRGVSMRVLGVQAADPDPMAPHGRTRSDLSPVYRKVPAVPMKLFVVDRAVALFPVTPSDLNHGYLEVSQAPVVEALVAVFERHWASGSTIPEHAMPQISLDEREQALIALLAQGHTDESAARELHISTRSVSATLRKLMDRLCVDNRFQLGLALGALHVASPVRPRP